MRFRAFLLLTRRLCTPTVARRGATFAALVVVERLLLPAAAWALFGGGLREQLAMALAVGAVLSARTYVQHAFRARTEVDLFERVVVRLVEGDVLRRNVLRDEDARAELGQAVYHSAQSVSVVMPLLIADAAAAVPLAAIIVAGLPAQLLVITLGMTLAVALAVLATRRSIDAALAGAWTAQQEAFAGFMDALEGRLDVVASGRKAAFLAGMHERAREWSSASARVAAGGLVSGRLPLLAIAAAAGVAVAFFGRREGGATFVTTAQVAVLAAAMPDFAGVAQGLFALARSERWMRVASTALAEPPASAGGAQQPPRLPASIALDGVSFRYEGMQGCALEDVTFTWKPGTVLALTGPNGSGKSTCVRLLLALATPHAGVVTVSGVPLGDVHADSWRSRIAFLPQRPYLPPQSGVRAAVRFLAPDASDAELRRALARVGLLAALERLGGDPLAVRVDALSVGERQRVALARMLCEARPVVLLDEPDANLDQAGIRLVADLVRELARGCMVALVAHNAELIEAADHVIALDGGRVVGDHDARRTRTASAE